jgi:hypothetical protein
MTGKGKTAEAPASKEAELEECNAVSCRSSDTSDGLDLQPSSAK